MIGRGKNLCLLGDVTGLLFSLYVKHFLPSIFNSVKIWSSMSCIVLNIELADVNESKELGVFIDGNVQGYSICPPKKYKCTKQAVWCTKNLHKVSWNSGRWIRVSLPTFFPVMKRVNFLQNALKNARYLAIYWVRRWKNWKITAVPKIKISLMKKCGFARVTHPDARPQFTVQSAKQDCLVTG